MDEDIEKIISDKFKTLPEDLQLALVSADYKTKLQDITKRQRLLIDQEGKLETETTLVMIGLEPLADFVTNIQKALGVPIMKAKEISLDVSENIFKPIRESLRTVNQKMTEGEPVMETEPSTKQLGSEDNLNREQIMNEIENPSLIKEKSKLEKPTVEAEISKSTEIETLDEVPYQQDIKINSSTEVIVPKNIVPQSNLIETKMAGITITPQQIVEAVPEVKLPPITEKRRPSSGVDPYREPIS